MSGNAVIKKSILLQFSMKAFITSILIANLSTSEEIKRYTFDGDSPADGSASVRKKEAGHSGGLHAAHEAQFLIIKFFVR